MIDLKNCVDISKFVAIRLSRIPVPIHVHEAQKVDDLAPHFVESAVGLVVVLDELAVRSVAEGGVGRVLAVAELVVPALGDVELDGPAASDAGVARAVAARTAEREPTGAPVVDFAFLQIHVVREPA